jgi:hypothetical protein
MVGGGEWQTCDCSSLSGTDCIHRENHALCIELMDLLNRLGRSWVGGGVSKAMDIPECSSHLQSKVGARLENVPKHLASAAAVASVGKCCALKAVVETTTAVCRITHVQQQQHGGRPCNRRETSRHRSVISQI